MAEKKRPDQLRRQHAKDVKVLPTTHDLKAPKWPFPDTPTKEEKARWSDIWTKPMAPVWFAWHADEVVARYVRLAVRAEAPGAGVALQAEVRQLEDRLGLNPVAVFKLQWTLGELEQKDAKTTAERVQQLRAVS